MKPSQILVILLVIPSLFVGCVTTREQMNEERGIGVEANDGSGGSSARGSVSSEEIAPKRANKESVKESELKEPEVVKSVPPMIAAPKENSGVVPAPVILKGDLANAGFDELRVEVARLTGRVEELEHEKEQVKKATEESEKKSQERIAELEKKLKEIQPDAPVVPEGKTPFEAGKEAYLSEKWDDAVLLMTQALEKQDTGKEAEEAVYVRAECYFRKQQYNKAIVDFSKFSEKYQKSAYHPKALLRIAEAFEAMGRKDDSKAFYSDLSEKFPKTAEGKLAKKRLKSKK